MLNRPESSIAKSLSQTKQSAKLPNNKPEAPAPTANTMEEKSNSTRTMPSYSQTNSFFASNTKSLSPSKPSTARPETAGRIRPVRPISQQDMDVYTHTNNPSK